MRPVPATVLALAVTLAGCLGANAPGAGDEPRADLEHVFADTLDGADGEAGQARSFTVEVPAGATGLAATVTWGEGGPVRLALVPPDGSRAVLGATEKPGRASVAVSEPPMPGAWEVRVTSSFAGRTPFGLRVTVDDGPAAVQTVEATLLLARGRVAEANVVLEPGATVTFKFESTKDVDWDVHTHDAETGAVATPVQGSAKSHEASFTAPARGLYSFALTALEEGTTVRYSVTGPLRVHSYTQG